MAAAALGRPGLLSGFLECLVTPLAAVIALVGHVVDFRDTTGFLFLVTLFAALGGFAGIFPHMVTLLTFQTRLDVNAVVKGYCPMSVFKYQGLVRCLDRTRIHHRHSNHADNKENRHETNKKSFHLSHLPSCLF